MYSASSSSVHMDMAMRETGTERLGSMFFATAACMPLRGTAAPAAAGSGAGAAAATEGPAGAAAGAAAAGAAAAGAAAGLGGLKFAVPKFDIPKIEVPKIEIPEVKMPEMDMPEMPALTAPPVAIEAAKPQVDEAAEARAAAEKAAAERAAQAQAEREAAAKAREEAAAERAKQEMADNLKAQQAASSAKPVKKKELSKRELSKSANSSSKAKTAKPAPKGTTLVGAIVGDVTVAAIAAALATALLVPGVKDKALGGDVEGALEDAKSAITSVDGLPGKAGYVGGVIAADAIAHLPVLGALIPGPAEFLGTAAAVLLASRYYVTKDGAPEDDLAAFGATLPGEFPPAVDSILSPVQGVAGRVGEIDLDILQDDIKQAPTRLQKWVGGLDDAAGVVAPPAAALGATVLAGQVANLPVLALVLPRALELVGIAYLVAAVNKYGSDPDADVKDDLAAAAKRGGDAVKKLAGK